MRGSGFRVTLTWNPRFRSLDEQIQAEPGLAVRASLNDFTRSPTNAAVSTTMAACENVAIAVLAPASISFSVMPLLRWREVLAQCGHQEPR